MNRKGLDKIGKSLQIKAKLLESGKIFIPSSISMPCFPSRSTAGPDAGMQCFTFQLNDSRIKLEVTDDAQSRFHLSEYNGALTIFEGQEVLSEVKVLPTLAHSPNQAFINLGDKCIHECGFCVVPHMEKDVVKDMGPERALRIINIAANYPGFEAAALTSGVIGSASETNRRMAEVVQAIRDQYPQLPIGVEAYFEEMGDIRRMKDAGADEIKVNIETWPEAIFDKVCPTRDRDAILEGLGKAVEVFGNGKVASNIIIGLGETDEEVQEGVTALAAMGVLANLRGLRVNSINKDSLKRSLGAVPERVSAERLIKLARMQKAIFEDHGLTTLDFNTMCYSCQCCDIVPMKDL